MTDRRSLWLTAIFASLILNGGFLWIVQALTFSETPGETKNYFPVSLVKLDTPPALKIIESQAEKPVSRLPASPKLKPKPESPPPAVNRNISQELAPQELPPPQEIGYDEKAPQEAEPVISPSVESASGSETSSAGAVSTGGQTGAETVASASPFVPIARLTKIPTFSRRVEPVYPENERVLGKETVVLAEIDLDEKGSIIEIRIINSGGKAFDQAVENALKKSQLTPGYTKDRAVPVRVQIPFAFKLK